MTSATPVYTHMIRLTLHGNQRADLMITAYSPDGPATATEGLKLDLTRKLLDPDGVLSFDVAGRDPFIVPVRQVLTAQVIELSAGT